MKTGLFAQSPEVIRYRKSPKFGIVHPWIQTSMLDSRRIKNGHVWHCRKINLSKDHEYYNILGRKRGCLPRFRKRPWDLGRA